MYTSTLASLCYLLVIVIIVDFFISLTSFFAIVQNQMKSLNQPLLHHLTHNYA